MNRIPPQTDATFTRDARRKVLAGVAAGLQREYLPNADLTLVRVGLVLLGIATGLLPLLGLGYVLLALLAPEN